MTLADVSISDSLLPDLTCMVADETVTFPTGLIGGASVTCTGIYEVRQADLDLGDPVTNTATVTATAQGQSPDVRAALITMTASATFTLVPQAPAMTLTKHATAVDGEPVSLGSPVTGLDADQVVTWTITARNSGNVTLTGVTVDDPALTDLACTVDDVAASQPATFGPGMALVCTGTTTISQDDVDLGESLTNMATATSDQLEDQTASATVYVAVAGPLLAVAKTVTHVNGEPALIGDGTVPVTGLVLDDVVTWQVTATNGGNVTLDGVTIIDEMLPDMTCTVEDEASTLPVTVNRGQSIVCTGTTTITQADIDLGEPIVNSATADSDRTGPVTTSATVTLAPQAPELALIKSATSGDGPYEEGDTVAYEFLVTNTGNVSLRDVVIDDPMPDLTWDGSTPDGVVGELAPGESVTLMATYEVTVADAEAGELVNEAVARAAFPGCDVAMTTVHAIQVMEGCIVESAVSTVAVSTTAPPVIPPAPTPTVPAPAPHLIGTPPAEAPGSMDVPVVTTLPATGHAEGMNTSRRISGLLLASMAVGILAVGLRRSEDVR